jgi:hypothetical protein
LPEAPVPRAAALAASRAVPAKRAPATTATAGDDWEEF